MLKVQTSGKEYLIEFNDTGYLNGTVNSQAFDWDVVDVGEGRFHIIKDNRSYNAEVVEADDRNKQLTIKVNGRKYDVAIKDRYDELLRQLGMEQILESQVKEIKAPMPGLVLDVMVGEGAKVKKGDPIVVLEAMKMENILKSPSDGTIKKINIQKDVAVEKNEVLINFE